MHNYKSIITNMQLLAHLSIYSFMQMNNKKIAPPDESGRAWSMYALCGHIVFPRKLSTCTNIKLYIRTFLRIQFYQSVVCSPVAGIITSSRTTSFSPFSSENIVLQSSQ